MQYVTEYVFPVRDTELNGALYKSDKAWKPVQEQTVYCGRDISASPSRKFRRIEQLSTSIDEKI